MLLFQVRQQSFLYLPFSIEFIKEAEINIEQKFTQEDIKEKLEHLP
jgi:hypothetical protein